MKIKLIKSQRGFSLVELLVVITIIGILTSIAIPIGNKVRQRGAMVHATQAATQLRTALMNYKSEYKRFPQLQGGEGDTEIETDGSSGLITALLAVPNAPATEKYNRRKIPFFSGRPAKTSRSGGIVRNGAECKLNDPWGNPFIILYDSDYNNELEVPSGEGEGTKRVSLTVAVWSYGPNGEPGKGTGSKNDDIYAF